MTTTARTAPPGDRTTWPDTLPLPGGGDTWGRWCALAALGRADLAAARLAEGHADALAVLAELGGPTAAPGERWGVWAAEPPHARVRATGARGGWHLEGTKAWCSGAARLDRALLTTDTDDGIRLMAVDLHQEGVSVAAAEWASAGMAGAGTTSVEFTGAAAVAVGDVGGYLDRPGFWLGGIGVAAVWWGGALGVGERLRRAERLDPHALAHLGRVTVLLETCGDTLRAAAVDADARPLADHARTAHRVRALVADAASEVLDRVGRALGPGPLATDPEHARRVADLTVFLRQHHAERDLAALGSLAHDGPPW